LKEIEICDREYIHKHIEINPKSQIVKEYISKDYIKRFLKYYIE